MHAWMHGYMYVYVYVDVYVLMCVCVSVWLFWLCINILYQCIHVWSCMYILCAIYVYIITKKNVERVGKDLKNKNNKGCAAAHWCDVMQHDLMQSGLRWRNVGKIMDIMVPTRLSASCASCQAALLRLQEQLWQKKAAQLLFTLKCSWAKEIMKHEVNRKDASCILPVHFSKCA